MKTQESDYRLEKGYCIRSVNDLTTILGKGNRDQRIEIVYDNFNNKIIKEEVFNYKGKESNYNVIDTCLSICTAGLFLLNRLIPSIKKDKQSSKCFDEKVRELIRSNANDLNKAIKDISVFQLSPTEIEKMTGKKAELVSTTKIQDPYKIYIHAENLFRLRVKASIIGANAIACYNSNGNYVLGTPIKISEK